MDQGSAIVGAILIAICIVPFILMSRGSRKKKKRMLQALTESAKQHNGQLSQHEFCGDFVIGFAEDINSVFFIKQKNEEAISQVADLSKIQSCQAVKRTRTIKNKGGNVRITERVELNFIPKDKSKDEINFELYTEENMQLSGELQLVDEWSKQINDRLKDKT